MIYSCFFFSSFPFILGVKTNYEYILTDPCLLSNISGHYGSSDCGHEFIVNWFNKHKCNRYCDPKWKTAKGNVTTHKIVAEKSTSYLWEVEKWAEKEGNQKSSRWDEFLRLLTFKKSNDKH